MSAGVPHDPNAIPPLRIRPFARADQAAAQALILAGLAERWGQLDPTLNLDLRDIATSYAAGCFLVAYWGDTLIATGALLPEGPGVGRIVRMSVRADLRGQGLGRRMLDALVDAARARGDLHLALETTSTWTDAIRFYTRSGFTVIGEHDGDTHFVLALAPGT